MLIRIIFLVLLAPLHTLAFAQLDSSSAVLLRARPQQDSPPAPKALDSSRYKIRAPESKPESKKVTEEELEEKPGTVIPTPVPSPRTNRTSSPSPVTKVITPAHNTEVEAKELSEPDLQASDEALTAKEEKGQASQVIPVSEQVRMLILGGSEEDITEHKKQIHPQDPRSNLLDISLAPGYFYQGSQSGYQYRRYNTHGPAVGLGMSLWITPFFGLQTDWFSSINASQRGPSENVVAAELQDFQAGIRFRKHFGYSRRAAYISWGLDFHDSTHKISRDGTNAVGKRTQGVSLGLEAVIPTSVVYAHQFQLDFRPRLSHNELIEGSSVRSGTKSETVGVALGAGGQWTLDRKNQVFWRSQLSVERNLFSGQATAPDPSTGLTPQGVSVNNTLLMFYFGFKWGS